MPTFAYSALKPDGSLARGELTANDRGEAMRRLDRSGLQPVSIAVKEGDGPAAAPSKKPSDSKAAEPTRSGDSARKPAEAKAPATASRVRRKPTDCTLMHSQERPRRTV